MSKARRFFSRNWAIEYTDAHGRTVRRKAGRTKEQAKAALNKAEADMPAQHHGLPTTGSRDLLLSELIEDYMRDLARDLKAPACRRRLCAKGSDTEGRGLARCLKGAAWLGI